MRSHRLPYPQCLEPCLTYTGCLINICEWDLQGERTTILEDQQVPSPGPDAGDTEVDKARFLPSNVTCWEERVRGQ